jgi:hypothetical protein
MSVKRYRLSVVQIDQRLALTIDNFQYLSANDHPEFDIGIDYGPDD